MNVKIASRPVTATEPQRRISLVLHSFDRGGSGRVAGHLARGFVEHGLDTELLVLCRGGATQRTIVDQIGGSVPIRFLLDSCGRRPLDIARSLPGLASALRERRPTDVVAAANNVALPAALAVRLAGLREARLFLKTTNPIAGSRHRGALRVARDLSYAWAFRRMTGVWTLSAQETEEMAAAYPDHSTLFRDVANPYVTDDMLAPSVARPNRRRKLIVTVARLTRQKRLERLLRAFSEVRRVDVDLLILGEGEERPMLEHTVTELGLDERVSMPGHVREVADTLRRADLFVLTSDYEGLPAVVLEAMAADCPVATTPSFPAARALVGRAPGCRIIEDVAPVALARLMEEMLEQPKPAGLRDLAARYSISRGVESHIAAMGA